MVGGGFYEPVLIAIPPQDRQEQIVRLADYIEKHFKERPRGAWLTERVWEPQIPSSLAPAGVEYTLLDDNHFLGAGFEPGQLFGHYTAEDLGHTVKVMPGLKTLRYLIPFRGIGETIEFLRTACQRASGRIRGDGRRSGEVRRVARNLRSLLSRRLAGEFFSGARTKQRLAGSFHARECGGLSRALWARADLPTASYTEMMEWALPTEARRRVITGWWENSPSRPDALPFLRGGVWRVSSPSIPNRI